MNKTKETKYLFKKMNNVEDGIERSVRLEEKSELPKGSKSSIVYHFDECNEKKRIWRGCKKWIMDNVMLVSTLGAVFVGVSSGMKNY